MLTLVADFAAMACVPALLAVQDVISAPPAPSRNLPLNGAVLGYGLMAVLCGAIIGLSLLPSKRGHQD